jgi:SAM-dependent methyltransferase
VAESSDYDRWYETPRGRWIGQREVRLLREGLGPHSGESLLDVGCGTGYFTRALAGLLEGPVVGVDVDPASVHYASSRRVGRESYAVADARGLPYAEASFDLVMSITALCFIDDEVAAVREIVRVARRRVALGLLNRDSLLWLQKRRGGSSGYQGARWHTVSQARALLAGLGVNHIRARTAVHLPGGGSGARLLERIVPPWLPTGAFILVAGDVARQG